ncbi:MAG: sigma-E factor negative regulatory protein RseB [Candidatus Poribacteria bacterium]|nr:sigma-E factor negative regulatory protein RseB [Candidatus Poribacteria bacterium]MDQ1329017.1 sigma-E factor negative regulatory protein RseB [Candidatus Poribacteria bacterium]
MAESERMVRNSLIFILIFACFYYSGFAQAEIPNTEDALQKLIRSSDTVNFIGKRVIISYAPNGVMIREELITRKAPDKKRIEILSPVEMKDLVIIANGNEPGRGMIFNRKDDNRKDNRQPDNRNRDRKMERRPPFPPPPFFDVDELPIKNEQALLRNYNVVVLYGGHVARRTTYLLEIEPKIYNKPARKVWMDTITGVPLKMEQYDRQRKLRSIFTYSEINFNPKINDAIFKQQNPHPPDREPRMNREYKELWGFNKGKLDVSSIKKAIKMSVMIPEHLPMGFDMQSIHLMKFDEHKSIHLIYSDGLTILSVFQSPLNDERPREDRGRERSKVGNMNIKGVETEVISDGIMFIFRWKYDNVNITLIGEQNLSEMVNIAGSFIK